MCAQILSDVDASAIKNTIESFTKCLEAQDFEQWAQYWAEDGVLMPPDHPRVVGRDALVDFIRTNFGNVQSVTFSDWQIAGQGTLAVATNNVQWTLGAGQPPAEPRKQVIVLSQDAAGKWLLKTIMFNAGV